MPSGVELATAYISVVAETGGMKKQIANALGEVDNQASKAGKGMGARLFGGVGAEGERAGRDTGMRFGNAVKGGLAAAGLAATAATVVAGIKQVFDAGLGFERNANTFQAVTRASAAEMEAMREKARELGSDLTLTGASASDAMSAMTELAKAGFSIDQSMGAARGTLQLAAAAQISAGEAATIQGSALLAFGKDASYAATTADVLANAANASSADIPDVAAALQQAGTVANQFGLSMEDTVASISLFANAGIKGSDAGTLLKSALLALTDQGNPAQGAIKDLGLAVYDASGNFVGMEALFGQLQAAAGRMSPEIYQAATNVLFGSDAARLAGVAAEQGATGWDRMRVAVARQGAAAEVAAAQTQGLPGVMERLSNTAEATKLALFDLFNEPAQEAGNWINDTVNKALDALNGLQNGKMPDWLKPLLDAGRDLLPVLERNVESAIDFVKVFGGAALTGAAKALEAIGAVAGTVVVPALSAIAAVSTAMKGPIMAVAVAFAAWKYLPGLLTAIGTPLQKLGSTTSAAVVTGVKSMGTAATSTATALRAIATANNSIVGTAGATATQMGRFGSTIAQIGTHVPVISRMQQSFIQGATGAERFGRTVGAASAAMTGFRSAGSAISGLFGGPWGAALAAATIGITLWSQSVSDANQRTKSLAASGKRAADAARDMYAAFSKSGGVVDDTVISKVNDQVMAFQETLETQRKGAGWGDWLRQGLKSTGQMAANFGTLGQADLTVNMDANNLQNTAEATEEVIKAQKELGVTNQQIAVVVSSSNGAWEIFADRLRGAGEGGQNLLRSLEPMRKSFLDNQAAAKQLTPGVATLEEAISTLADTTGTAEQKTAALKSALDVLAGKQPDAQEATAQYNETVQQIAQSTQEAWDAQKGYGAALVNADGTVNTSTENGLKLYEALKNIKDGTIDLAGAGGDMKAAFAGNEQQFAQLASAAGLNADEVRRMAEAMGLVPQRIETLMALNGATDTKEQLTLVKELIGTVPPGTTVTVNALTGEAKQKLIEAGFMVDEFKAANGETQLRITATGQAAIDEINRVTSQMNVLVSGGSGTWTATAAPGQGAGQFDRPGGDPARGGGGFATAGDAQRARRGYEYGGRVTGGRAGKDSVPSLLMPDEHVLDTQDVKNFGGHAGVYAMRSAAAAGWRPFEQGGAVGPVDPMKVREAQDSLADNQNALVVAQAELKETMGKGDAKGTTLLSAQQAVAAAQRKVDQSTQDAEAIAQGLQPADRSGEDAVFSADGAVAMAIAKRDELKASGSGDPSALMAADYEVTSAQRDAGQARTDQAAKASTRTEGYIPAGAGNSGSAGTSFASGLYQMGAEAINGLIDQAASAASTGASLGVNAVAPGAGGAAASAIGIGTQAAKRGVQYGAQMLGIGTDALAEILLPFGVPRFFSTDPTSFIPQLPSQAVGTTTAERAVNAANGSAVDPATTAHGQGAGAPPGPTTTAPAPGGAQSALDVVTPATGGPAGTPPGPGEVVPPWMKNIGVVPGLFDDGGWLEPDQMAINKSNRPEPVFSGRQWDALGAATMAPNPDPATMGGVHFNDTWTVTVKDVDELEQKQNDRKRRQMKRYGGRPSLA